MSFINTWGNFSQFIREWPNTACSLAHGKHNIIQEQKAELPLFMIVAPKLSEIFFSHVLVKTKLSFFADFQRQGPIYTCVGMHIRLYNLVCRLEIFFLA